MNPTCKQRQSEKSINKAKTVFFGKNSPGEAVFFVKYPLSNRFHIFCPGKIKPEGKNNRLHPVNRLFFHISKYFCQPLKKTAPQGGCDVGSLKNLFLYDRIDTDI